VVTGLTLRRLGRQVVEALGAGVLGVLLGQAVTWSVRTWGSEELVDALAVRLNGEFAVNIPAYIAGVGAMLTVAGPRTRRRVVAWSWNLLWVALGITLITGQISLPGLLVVVLVGRVAGFAVRYVAGARTERAYGADLVAGLRRAGFEPRRVVRVRDLGESRSE